MFLHTNLLHLKLPTWHNQIVRVHSSTGGRQFCMNHHHWSTISKRTVPVLSSWLKADRQQKVCIVAIMSNKGGLSLIKSNSNKQQPSYKKMFVIIIIPCVTFCLCQRKIKPLLGYSAPILFGDKLPGILLDGLKIIQRSCPELLQPLEQLWLSFPTFC